MQHIQVKLFAEPPAPQDLAPAIAVFHRWIQRQALPGLMVDVADYAHVPMGPGVLLIGHEWNVSLDLTGGRLGLLFNRKTAWTGPAEEALPAAYEMAARAADLLEQEPEFAGRLRFRRDEFEVTLNDRLLYPNRQETLAAVEPLLRGFARTVFGGDGFRLEREADERRRFAVTASRA
jgi:hypothetical protein